MWLVRIALARRYTFIVAALLIVVLGVLSIRSTPTDVFPSVRVPVVGIVWNYGGIPPRDMADRIVGYYERVLTTTVSNVEHIESQSLHGVGVVKVYFQPSVNPDRAVAEVTAVSQTALRFFPPGTTPPLILVYDASSVPVLQLALSSPSLLESQLFDAGNSFIRTQLATVPGAALPFPYGGAQRQIQVDVDPSALRSRGLSVQAVANAIGAQNVIEPAGTQKIGPLEFDVITNSAPDVIAELNEVPIRAADGTVTFVRDVGHVRDGSPPQTNVVRVDGRRAVLMSVIKTGNASTLDVVSRVRELLPFIRSGLPADLSVRPIADQSVFVRSAISGVLLETVLAALLTGFMILLFLGNVRSTFIILVSIPLAILSSLIALRLLGQTINIMTLGGLALAVGILVDDATVTLESVNYHLEQGKDIRTAILDGAQQIAVPAFVSTLAICLAFAPMFLLSGASRFLFVPMAEAVVFAMLASYALSRTLVPTLASYWVRHAPARSEAAGPIERVQRRFEAAFERFRVRHRALVARAIGQRKQLLAAFAGGTVLSIVVLLPWLGRDFFPGVDAGQIKLHLRAPSGTRIEETAVLCDAVEDTIRRLIPASELDSVVDNIGLPNSGINLLYSNSAPIGPADADILVSLKSRHASTSAYERALRRSLAASFPDTSFAFLPADIVTQILNFGVPAPIAIEVTGRNADGNRQYANFLMARLRAVPGLADLRLQQTFDNPQLKVVVDRTRAAQLGFTARDVADNLLTTLSGTVQTAPTFWADRRSGIQYPISTQIPQYRLPSLPALAATPFSPAGGAPPALFATLATVEPGVGPGVVSHLNALPALDIYGSVSGSDLGSVGTEVRRIVADTASALPKGSRVIIRGQLETMRVAYTELACGLLLAIVLIYLLMVVNFQSWTDPLIIAATLPVAIGGIVWMLFLTGTPLSVPALTGGIMCIGVATANSILVVSFARERLAAGSAAAGAAIEAASVRLRPVLMTAGAMIVGMVPMALGLGDGGEQNAPLGRAVIGGLLAATFATLLLVPALFTALHGARPFTGAVRTDGRSVPDGVQS
jgi:multidrug efflux pump subunit AcrB